MNRTTTLLLLTATLSAALPTDSPAPVMREFFRTLEAGRGLTSPEQYRYDDLIDQHERHHQELLRQQANDLRQLQNELNRLQNELRSFRNR